MAGILVGCTPTEPKPYEKPSLEQIDNDNLSYVRIGMSFAEFRRLFPASYFAGHINNNKMVYALNHSYPLAISADTHYRVETMDEKLHFYFENGRLVQWELPVNWDKQTNIEFN